MRIREIGDLLAEFSGDKDTFVTWKSQAKILRATYQLNEDTMKILLSSRLKGKAQEWFHSTPTHLQLTIHELFEQMDMFNNRKSKLELRRSFEKRSWQTAEFSGILSRQNSVGKQSFHCTRRIGGLFNRRNTR